MATAAEVALSYRCARTSAAADHFFFHLLRGKLGFVEIHGNPFPFQIVFTHPYLAISRFQGEGEKRNKQRDLVRTSYAHTKRPLLSSRATERSHFHLCVFISIPPSWNSSFAFHFSSLFGCSFCSRSLARCGWRPPGHFR